MSLAPTVLFAAVAGTTNRVTFGQPIATTTRLTTGTTISASVLQHSLTAEHAMFTDTAAALSNCPDICPARQMGLPSKSRRASGAGR